MTTDLSFWDPDRTKTAIDCLCMYCPPEGYYLAFSGGKDSIVVKRLLDMAGVPYDAHMSLTTVDPKEVLQYVKEFHPDVELVRPQETMMELIVRHGMPPTRRVRYCCEALKEREGNGRIVLTGIRKEESSMRGKRRMVEHCLKGRGKIFVNPIIDWSSVDVWAFIKEQNLEYCELYDQGFERIGCVGCPMSRKQRLMEFERWPNFKKAYLRAFARMLHKRKEKGLKTVRWETPEDVMAWWLDENRLKYDSHQMLFSLFE